MPYSNSTRMKSNNWKQCSSNSNRGCLLTTARSKQLWLKLQRLRTLNPIRQQHKFKMIKKAPNLSLLRTTCLLPNLWSSSKWKGTKSSLLPMYKAPHRIKRNNPKTRMNLTFPLRSLKTLMMTFLQLNLRSKLRVISLRASSLRVNRK